MPVKNAKRINHVLPARLYKDLQENEDLLFVTNEGQKDIVIMSAEKYRQEIAKLTSLQYLEKLIDEAVSVEKTEKLTLPEEQKLLTANQFVQLNLYPEGYEKMPFLYVKNYYPDGNGSLAHYWLKMNTSFRALIQAVALGQRCKKEFMLAEKEKRDDILKNLCEIASKMKT